MGVSTFAGFKGLIFLCVSSEQFLTSTNCCWRLLVNEISCNQQGNLSNVIYLASKFDFTGSQSVSSSHGVCQSLMVIVTLLSWVRNVTSGDVSLHWISSSPPFSLDDVIGLVDCFRVCPQVSMFFLFCFRELGNLFHTHRCVNTQ